MNSLLRWLTAALLLSGLGGCGALLSKTAPQPAFYALDGVPAAVVPSSPASAPTLLVEAPHAVSGFDSPRIIYTRTPHQLEYFAHSEWVDSPARMLAPLLVSAVEASGSFRAVVMAPSAAASELRLDTEIVRLQQEFSGGGASSRVRFTLRAYLIDNQSRQVLAWREFDETVAAASDDPPGGVRAANRAVQQALAKLAVFCADTTASWQPAARLSRIPRPAQDAFLPAPK